MRQVTEEQLAKAVEIAAMEVDGRGVEEIWIDHERVKSARLLEIDPHLWATAVCRVFATEMADAMGLKERALTFVQLQIGDWFTFVEDDPVGVPERRTAEEYGRCLKVGSREYFSFGMNQVVGCGAGAEVRREVSEGPGLRELLARARNELQRLLELLAEMHAVRASQDAAISRAVAYCSKYIGGVNVRDSTAEAVWAILTGKDGRAAGVAEQAESGEESGEGFPPESFTRVTTAVSNYAGDLGVDEMASFRETTSDGRPVCPGCGAGLHVVEKDANSALNDEQFGGQRAGDWYCDLCKGSRSKFTRYRYFWNSELRLAPAPQPLEVEEPWARTFRLRKESPEETKEGLLRESSGYVKPALPLSIAQAVGIVSEMVDSWRRSAPRTIHAANEFDRAQWALGVINAVLFARDVAQRPCLTDEDRFSLRWAKRIAIERGQTATAGDFERILESNTKCDHAARLAAVMEVVGNHYDPECSLEDIPGETEADKTAATFKRVIASMDPGLGKYLALQDQLARVTTRLKGHRRTVAGSDAQLAVNDALDILEKEQNTEERT